MTTIRKKREIKSITGSPANRKSLAGCRDIDTLGAGNVSTSSETPSGLEPVGTDGFAGEWDEDIPPYLNGGFFHIRDEWRWFSDCVLRLNDDYRRRFAEECLLPLLAAIRRPPANR